MKTAISIPDETFDRVAQRASDLGMSRSEHLHGTDEVAAAAVGHSVLQAVDDDW